MVSKGFLTLHDGLLIRKISNINNASFIKLGEQASTANSILSHSCKNHYFKFQNIWNAENTIYGSRIWKKIGCLAHHFHQGSSSVMEKKSTSGTTPKLKENPCLFVSHFWISPRIKDYPPCTNQSPGNPCSHSTWSSAAALFSHFRPLPQCWRRWFSQMERLPGWSALLACSLAYHQKQSGQHLPTQNKLLLMAPDA